MGTRMLQRRGTAAEWSAANPILGDGELGYIRDTDHFKVGDGVTAWNDLQTFRYIHPSLIDAAGDLLVGSANDTVARLARGSTGQTLFVQVDGSLAWGTPYSGADRVAKSGDTMTGTLSVPRVDLGAVNILDNGGVLAVVQDDGSTLANLGAANVYDNNQRVYSPNNPPPASISPTIVDAKGDLIVGTGSDTVARLPRGSTGQRLSVQADGSLAWVDMPAAPDLSPYADKNTSTQQTFTAAVRSNGGLYDGANRVYSASNPPPTSGSSINQTMRGTIQRINTGAGDVGYNDATISSVVMAKTQLRFLGADSSNAYSGYLQLISSTTVRWKSNVNNEVVSYELTEWS